MIRTQFEYRANGHIGKAGKLIVIDEIVVAGTEKEAENTLAEKYRDKARERVVVYCTFEKVAEIVGEMEDAFFWGNAKVTRKDL